MTIPMNALPVDINSQSSWVWPNYHLIRMNTVPAVQIVENS